jgi:OOP family OmpA-OmpF porin
MKNIVLGALFLCLTIQGSAQEYNHWSLDFGAGVHRIVSPLSEGYKSDLFGLGQANFGVRYMLNEKFGIRVGVGYNEFQESENSLPFRANYYRANIEGVVNIGNIFKFSSWTKRFNFLFHSGVGYSNLKTITPVDTGNGEDLFNIMIGFTPQYKLSNRISLFLDVSTIMHDSQDNTYNGAKNNLNSEKISTSLFNTSIGVNISLGKDKENADFLKDEELVGDDKFDEITKRLDKAETEIAILKVKKAEVNKIALVKELDTRYAKKEELVVNRYESIVTGSNVAFIRKLLNSGYVNVYFDVNKSIVQKGSLNSVNYLITFMEDNPTVSALLIGYADETGTEKNNQALSKKRAESVFELLIAAGISKRRLSFTGGGEDKSVAKKARQFARKVTFQIN